MAKIGDIVFGVVTLIFIGIIIVTVSALILFSGLALATMIMS